ncbi:unnamed protein product [Tetraodon nigroviridis]|uniref:(spotted green pufferfish) hypothetical protein n=1 Tax=Tetraodon nigroviridis TaxID=99883 RepID=Q4SUX9_TETNG|nr:unnamed protein product [Tetraodon nigroviridis]
MWTVINLGVNLDNELKPDAHVLHCPRTFHVGLSETLFSWEPAPSLSLLSQNGQLGSIYNMLSKSFREDVFDVPRTPEKAGFPACSSSVWE